MPRYLIENNCTRERREVEAPFAQDACEKCGWLIGHCYVKLLREGPFTHTDSAIATCRICRLCGNKITSTRDICAWCQRFKQRIEANPELARRILAEYDEKETYDN